MAKTLKPHDWWGVTYVNGNDVMPDTIRRTRREARAACAAVGNQGWEFWKKHGCRDVRVVVIVQVDSIAAAPKLAGEE